MSQTIRVLIVDDHTIVRKGIRALLTEIAGIEVVGEAADGQEAVAQANSLRPDVILMDLAMPKMDGIEATRQIKTSQPESRILVMTSFATDDKVLPAIKAGALGYLLKESAPEDLVQAIQPDPSRRIVAPPDDRPQSLARDCSSLRPSTDARSTDQAGSGGAAPGGARAEQPGHCQEIVHQRRRPCART